MKKAIFKFNNGNGALLCSKCRTIIRQGSGLTEHDRLTIKGEASMKPQYCTKCIKDNI